jgi:hypothetical protein
MSSHHLVARLCSLLALSAALACVAGSARGDVAGFGPQIRWSFRIETADTEHVWVAYPVNRSRGVPMIAYERVAPGEPFDPGRSGPAIYAFPADRVVGTEDVPPAPSLRGAPRPFGAGDVPSGSDALAAFFDAEHVPHGETIVAPSDPALVDAQVTSVIDTFAPSIEGDRVVLTLLRSEYGFADRMSRELPARADGTRDVPTAMEPPDEETEPAPPAPSPTGAAPTPAGCGCVAAGGARGGASGALLLAFAAWAVRRRRT